MILDFLKKIRFKYRTRNKKIVTMVSTSGSKFVGLGKEARDNISNIAFKLMEDDFNNLVPESIISFQDAFDNNIITGTFSYRTQCDKEDWPTHSKVTSRSLLNIEKLNEYVIQKKGESIWG